MKIISATMILLLVLALSEWRAMGGEHGWRGDRSEKHREIYESKFYGEVEKIPEDFFGEWIISERTILVTKDTFIEEEYGRATVGAYVEVEGTNQGKTIKAYKIEVKRGSR
jgi:hypothetical protein